MRMLFLWRGLGGKRGKAEVDEGGREEKYEVSYDMKVEKEKR